jgi:hypothetical protein
VPLPECGENSNLFSAVSIIWGEERQQNGQIKGTGLEDGDNGYRNGRTGLR